MKHLIIALLISSIYGCSSYSAKKDDSQVTQQAVTKEVSDAAVQQCPGNTELPVNLAGKLEAIEDEPLLKSALGQPTKGKLCQGQVYQSKENSNLTIYRAWNSTNPNSELGIWWAFHRPEGKVSQYRSDYEICYQWSPLDKLTTCTLKAGVKVVVGTGQSATCSEYLTYPVSAAKQIYIQDAGTSVSNCTVYDAKFSWE